MRLSVLLPTRNRNDLLGLALSSVLDQDHGDLQVVVSDNNSDPAAAPPPSVAGDPRLRWLRHERTLPVSDSWNAADQAADGLYTVMLGDDDALMPGALTTVAGLAAEWDEPDLIFASAWFYAWPGAVDGFPDGFAKRDVSPIFSAPAPYLLDPDEARRLVAAAMDLRMPYPFNMQFSFVHRRLREAMPDGELYRSPYPDYYATNACFQRARRILVVPSPMTVIGISPKSYGHMHFKGKEAEGGLQHAAEDALAGAPLPEGTLLPGSRSASCFLGAMAYLARAMPEAGRPSIHRYRRMQIEHHARRRHLLGAIDDADHRRFTALLTPRERWLDLAPLAAAGTLARITGFGGSPGLLRAVKRLLGRRHAGALAFDGVLAPPPEVRDILAARTWLARGPGA